MHVCICFTIILVNIKDMLVIYYEQQAVGWRVAIG